MTPPAGPPSWSPQHKHIAEQTPTSKMSASNPITILVTVIDTLACPSAYLMPFSVELNLFTKLFAALYTVAVFCSMLYGLGRGIAEWAEWMLRRRPIRLNKQFKWVEPIVNATKDSGYAVWFVISCAGFSSFVAATFPISVPTIAYFFAEPEEEPKPKKAQQQPEYEDQQEQSKYRRGRTQY